MNEPENDCWPTASDLGNLSYLGSSVSNGWWDRLPGYIDVDIFGFHVPYAEDWWTLDFTVYHGGDEGAQYALDLYCDGWDRGSYSNFPGENVHVVLPAETGYWQAKVRTADGIISAPSPYGFEVFRTAPAVGAPEGGASTQQETLELKVNSVTRLASGPRLMRPGVLRLFDAAGREVWTRDIPAGVVWSEPVPAKLTSGVYFLRLSEGRRSIARQLVVVT